MDGAAVTHDAKGNLTGAADGRSFSWDFDNRLAAASVPDGSAGTTGTHSYSYDVNGRRVTKTVAGARTLFVCLGQQVICEYIGNSPAVNSPDQRYVYGSYVDEPILKQAGKSILYYSRNQQFSVTALSNASGQVLERYAYTPYGAVTVLAGCLYRPLFVPNRDDRFSGVRFAVTGSI